MEIQELKNRIKELEKENEELKGIKNGTTIEYIGKATYWRKDKIEKYFISKDIIRNKIKEVQEKDIDYCKYAFSVNEWKDFVIDKLNELLGE